MVPVFSIFGDYFKPNRWFSWTAVNQWQPSQLPDRPRYLDGEASDDSIRSLAGGHLARFVPIDIFCPLCPLWCCAPDLAAMAKYFDGDASGEMTTSETSDRLDEAIRSLAGGNLARCFPIEISRAVWQLARLPLTQPPTYP